MQKDQMKLGYPITTEPYVPDILKHTVHWKTLESEDGCPVAGFVKAADGLEWTTPECLEMFKTAIATWLENFPEFSEELEKALPMNTIAVALAEDNFEVGKSCQEFLPLEESKISDDAFYTYQMISENVQATYYNKNGVEFLAGICWYLPSNGKTISLTRDAILLSLAQFSAEPFPLQDRNKSFFMTEYDKYGRYCKTAGRRVAVDCSGMFGIVHHIDVNLNTNSYEYTPCRECSVDYFTYKWEDPKKSSETPSTTMMQLMTSVFTYPYRTIQDRIQRNQMTKGYPITTEPFVPDIMKHKVEWKVIECKDGHRKVAFALASDGLELVEPESLEMVRERLWGMFHRNLPEHAKELEKILPRNTLAISFCERSFQVGASCQEFLPIEAYKTSEEFFLTHQRMSENVQVTYYNHNGNQFLAGICYYPVPNGNVMYLKNDSALIDLARMSSEEYPLCDRSKLFKNVNYNMYGRFCKSSGKRVVVDCSGKYGAVLHWNFNHFTEKYEYVKCMECLEDAATYKWEDPKKNDPAPVRRHPHVPDILKYTAHWKTWVSKGGRPILGFTEAAESMKFSTPEYLEMFRSEIAKWLENFPEFSKDIETPLPRNTIAVSFAQRNFKVGKSCQEFLPLDKFKIPDEAFYTYQMISETVQATYYNENGVEFLAGICWYHPSNGKITNMNKDLKLINLTRFSAEPFPLQDRNESFNKIKNNIYGRYCKEAGKRVAIDCSGKYGTICHIDVNLNTNSYDYTGCEECSEDYSTYKWAESKNENPTPIDSPKPSEAARTLPEAVLEPDTYPSITTDLPTKNGEGSDDSESTESPAKECTTLLDISKPAEAPTLLSDTAEPSVATLPLDNKTLMSSASSTESLLKDFHKLVKEFYDKEFDAEIIN